MDKNLKSTSILQSQQKGKTPTFHVQTGVRAGGFRDQFYAWWQGVAEGFNAADQAAGELRPSTIGMTV